MTLCYYMCMAYDPEDARYTLTELADLAGVTPRTVRYYLAQGLLPAVGVAGPGAKYADTHLARLRLIKRLQRAHQPLAEIRHRLAQLDDDAIAAITSVTENGPPPASALDYILQVTGQVGPVRGVGPGPLPGHGADPGMDQLTRQMPDQARDQAPRQMPDQSNALVAPTGGPALPSRVARFMEASAPSGPPVMGQRSPSPLMPARNDPPTPPKPPSRIGRSQWDRVTLAPDVELHIRRPLPRPISKRVDRLVEIARELLQEEPS